MLQGALHSSKIVHCSFNTWSLEILQGVITSLLQKEETGTYVKFANVKTFFYTALQL